MKTLNLGPINIVILLAMLTAPNMACRTAPVVQDEPPVAESPVEEEAPEPEPEPRSARARVQEAPPSMEELDDLEQESSAEVEEELESVAPHVDARIQAALSRLDADDREAARQTLLGLVDEPEGGFLAIYNLGVLHDRYGEGPEAARRYIETLRRQPDFTPALTNLLRLYIRAGEISEARTLADRYVTARPENLDHQAARLEVWAAEGRFEDVIAGARDILRRDISQVEAMYQMAIARFELGQLELAEAIMQRALQLSPERAEFYFLLALSALAQDNDAGARANLRRAIELQPHFPEARNHYGVLLHESGNHDRAIEQFEAAVNDAPAYVEATINLGNAYKAIGKYDLAEAAFQDALDVDERSAAAHFNLGILYLEAPVPGYEDIPKLEKAVESFSAYRQIVGSSQASQGPVAAYINEANTAIEREQARQEMLRRAQMNSANSPGTPGTEDVEEDDDE